MSPAIGRGALPRLAWRGARARPLRLTLSVTCVALGVAVVVAIHVLNAATIASLGSTLDAITGTATLQVSGTSAGIDARVLDVVRATEGVEAATPLVIQHLESPDAGPGTLTLFGVDPSAEELVRSYDLDRGTLQALLGGLSPQGAPPVLVSRGLARRLERTPGQTFVVRAPGLERKFLLAGVVEPRGVARAYDDALVVAPLPIVQALFARAGRVDRIDVVTAREDRAAVADRLTTSLGGRAQVSSAGARGEELASVLFGMQAMLSVVSFLALLVGGFLVTTTVGVSLAERARELALLRTLGATRSTLRILLVGEQAVLGALAGTIGAALGILGAFLARGLLETTISRAYTAVSVELRVFDPGAMLLGAAAGGLATALAAWPPVTRALGRPIVENLRDHSAPPAPAGGWRWGTRVLAALLLAAFVAGLLAIPRPPTTIAAGLLSIGFLLVLAAPWTRGVARVVGSVLHPLFGVSAQLAERHVRRAESRSVLTVIAIALGVALALEVQVTLASSEAEVFEWIDDTVAGDMMITRVGMLEPSGTIPPLDAGARERVESIEGVRQAAPVRLARFSHHGDTVLLIAFGERVDARRLSFVAGHEDDARARFFAGEAALISESFARFGGLEVGDDVEIPGARGGVVLPVAGVIVDYSWPRGVVFLEHDAYVQRFEDPLVDELIVTLEEGADPEVVKQRIRATLGTLYPDLFLVTTQEFEREVRELLQSFFLVSHAQSGVTLLVAYFGVLGTLFIAVLDRRRELSMLRATGATRAQVVLAITIEGALLGLAGSLAGVALGAWVGHVAVEHVSPAIQGWRMPTIVPPAAAVLLVATCTVTSIVASLPPALHGSSK